MTDTPSPAHPPRIAKKPDRRKPKHGGKVRKPQAKPTVLVRHGLLAGDPKT